MFIPWNPIIKLAVSALGIWLVASSFTPDLNYGRLVTGLLFLWVSTIWLKQYVELKRGRARGWLNWGITSLLAVIPGLILLWYGLLTPAQPSLTNSGIDVCALQTGWCVSGTRAFIFWGGIVFLAGLAWAFFTYSGEKKARG